MTDAGGEGDIRGGDHYEEVLVLAGLKRGKYEEQSRRGR